MKLKTIIWKKNYDDNLTKLVLNTKVLETGSKRVETKSCTEKNKDKK